MRYLPILLALTLLATTASCSQKPAEETNTPGIKVRRGVVEVELPNNDRVVAGQTVYVPAYPAVYTSDRGHAFNLAITLCLRNTDRAHPIIISALKYYDQEGQVVRDYLKKPLQLAPLASMSYFVAESDQSGGIGACFITDWVAERSVTPPLVEAVMVGTSSQQGVSFVCPGRVLVDRTRPKSIDSK